jgi:hypothetical protein
MEYELRVVVEKVAVSTQEVVKRDTLKIYEIQCPASILELGLRHTEQISLLSKLQNALLAEQTALIRCPEQSCPNCGSKLKKNGYLQSDFHAVFSDHKIRQQKYLCTNPACSWHHSPTVKSLFGNAIHPDLAKLQCEQGAFYSYREAQSNLTKVNCQARSVNNHNQLKLITNQVGEVLSQRHQIPPTGEENIELAQSLIVQVDGGHIPIQDKDKRSFEALSAVVYRPENIRRIDQNHSQITNKTCAISALNDQLQTMKTYLLNAALLQGMTLETKVTALADGAKNCWSTLEVLRPYCQQVECVLDWFHIAQKFQIVKNALAVDLEPALERAKWKLWHGQAQAALLKLAELQKVIRHKQSCSKLRGLYDFIHRNQAYIVNYEERQKAEKPFSSQVAESHVESLINARHKRSGKMQWTREGAHNVLQIRAEIASQAWNRNWQQTVLAALGAVA